MRNQIADLIRPEKRTARRSSIGADENSGFGFSFAREKFGDLGICQHTSESRVLAALSLPRLEFVKLGLVRFHELRSVYAQVFFQYLAQFLSQDDRDRSGILRVNGNLERAGVAIVSVNGAVSFPNAVSVASRMIVVANEKNFGPEVFVERVLGFDGGEIVAGRDNAAVQNDQIAVPGGENDSLLWPAAEGDAGEKDGGVIGKFTKETIIHEPGDVLLDL